MFKIFSDFDNTIITVDCTDTILNHFADKSWINYEQDYKDNKLSAKECLDKQISLLNINPKNLENFILENITIEYGFLNFVKTCTKFNYPLIIVSDGLDTVIKLILQKYSLNNIPFYSNKLSFKLNYELSFPFSSVNCKGGLGTCKCNIINRLKDEAKCVYIGDGSSDFCVVQNIPNLIIFAKDKLAHFCKQKQIKYYPFKNFFDVTLELDKLKGI